MVKLGRAFKIVRQAEGKTQQEVAEALGVSVWRISRLEGGIQSPRPSEAAALQVVLPRLRELLGPGQEGGRHA